MRLVPTNPEQDAALLEVMAAVATARGTDELSAADRAALDAAAAHVLGGVAQPTSYAGTIPGNVGDVLDGPEVRDLALTLASVMTFADPEVDGEKHEATLDPNRVAVVDDLARYLGVATRDVHDLRALTKRHRELVEYCLFRRFATSAFDLGMGKATAQQTAAMLGVHSHEHRAMWSRFEQLPDRTIGAELIRYYHDNGWAYPGTAHKQPLSFAIHDFHHVLGGYPTTPHGELQVGAFTGGAADRPLDTILFFLTWEQLGVRDTFDAVDGAIGQLEPEPFFAALERGGRSTGEFIGDKWDPWSTVELDLDEARERFGIGPGEALAPGDAWNRDPATADPATMPSEPA